MTIRVIIHIYSGRADPEWTLDGAQETELRRLIASDAFDTARPIIPWRMGYRGFTIIDPAAPQQPLLRVQGRSYPVFSFFGAPEVEEFLMSTAPPDDPDAAPERVPRLHFDYAPPIAAASPVPERARIGLRAVTPSKAADALPWRAPGLTTLPASDPLWGAAVQYDSNCYAYAINQNNLRRTPGDGGGGPGTDAIQSMGYGIGCAGPLAGVLFDGLFRTTGPDQTLGPGEGMHCCLVIHQGDFHWYRQDADGYWSHKLGSDLPTRLDASGQMIADPRFCNRGPYTLFVAWLRAPRSMWIPLG